MDHHWITADHHQGKHQLVAVAVLDQDSKFNRRQIKHKAVLTKATIVVSEQKTAIIVLVKVSKCKKLKNKIMKRAYKMWVEKYRRKARFQKIKIKIHRLELAIV